MSNHVEKLTGRILGACNGEEFGCVIGSLVDATIAVLQAIPDEHARASFIITIIDQFASLPNHNDCPSAALKAVLSTIRNVRSEKTRDMMVLGHIEALTTLSIDHGNFDPDTLAKKMEIV